MKIILSLLFALTTQLTAQSIEEQCEAYAKKINFEKELGSTTCGNTIYLDGYGEAEVVDGNRCKIRVELEESWTDMQCPSKRKEKNQRENIFSLAKRPFVNAKFNKLCKKFGFQRVKKGKTKYGNRYIVCSKRIKAK